MVQLTKANEDNIFSVISYHGLMFRHGIPRDEVLISEMNRNPAEFLALTVMREKGIDDISGYVPFSTFYIVVGEVIVGDIRVRYKLNEQLLQEGGHIGYALHPDHRRRGYGTAACKLALDFCKDIGLKKVLITCDEQNTASRKIIESVGGIADTPYAQSEDKAVLRYWVEL